MKTSPPSVVPRCSIVVVNYNGRHLLHDCLESVLRDAGDNAEVILVDNGSSDGSVQFVRQHFSSVIVVEAGSNLGYAGGNNLGVRSARADIIVLLNNDTFVEPGWLEGLLRALAPPDVAIASSLVRTEGIPEHDYERNGSINFLGHNIMQVFNEPDEIFYCGGTSLAFKRDLLGIPFDEDFFAYSEDVYLSLRARFLGYHVVHTSDSRVTHLGGGTTHRSSIRPFLLMMQERNRLLNMLLFFSGRTLLKVIPFFAANMVAKYIAGLVSSRFSLHASLRAHWWLVTHGGIIMTKRRHLHADFRVPETKVIAKMTSRLTQGRSFSGRVLNRAALFYCRLMNLCTIELSR